MSDPVGGEQQTQTQTQQGAPAIPWFPTADEAAVSYLQNKKWTEPGQLLDAYRGAERFISAPVERRLVMPAADASPEEVSKFYGQLGRPADPSGYKLETPQGGDPEFAKTAAGWLHKHNVPAKMAEGLVQELNAYASGKKQASETARAEARQADDAALRQEWGAAFDQNLEQARTFVRGMGLKADVIDKLSDSMGHAATLKFFQQLGAKMGEASYVEGGKTEPFGAALTPAQAQDRISALMKDKEFTTKYRNKDAGAMAEMERLHKYAYPEPKR